ncbi:MAG: nthB [Panacagrimonas sp.]|jgi:nitrile hydratase|nr:SH3-like domain-containing protein [Panacagrimonas sp.]MCC2656379.1 nthB [Panacagrimonas sp.]
MPALPKEMVPGLLAVGASARLPDKVPPRFRVGDAVIARNVNPVGHTRVPRYIKSRRGVVHLDHGVFAFPDAAAGGLGHIPQHVYSVRFMARELWGEQASPLDSIHIDLFDEYMDLDPAAAAAPAQEPGAATERPHGRSRRSARPARSGRSKARKARRPGVRLKKSEGPKAASGARKPKKASKNKKKAAPAKARKVAAKPGRAKKVAKKARLVRR